MSEHEGHRDRLRARLEREGIDHFAPHEVLELILFYSVPRANTNPIAHRLLERFGSLSGVFEAPHAELLKVPGVGPASATLLCSIPLFARRYLRDKNAAGLVLDNSEKLSDYLRPLFIGKSRETVYLLCFDQKRKLLTCTMLAQGSIDQVSVVTRTIIETALRCSASVVVLAHNHDQGFALPSNADLRMTRQLIEALRLVSIELVDHIIVAREDCVSLFDSRLI